MIISSVAGPELHHVVGAGAVDSSGSKPRHTVGRFSKMPQTEVLSTFKKP
jgi:hypothetical protein